MSQSVPAEPGAPDTVYPPPISLGHELPWVLFGLSLLLLLYFVGVDEGAASVLQGSALHEFVHDGRHLLAFPCH